MFSEDPILLPEIVDQIVLVTVHPASEREDEELQRRRHSLRLLGRLDQHRPSLGRFFAPYAVIGNKSRATWLCAAIEVCSRLWAGSVLGRRASRNATAVLNDVILRGRVVGFPLIATDGFEYYVGVIERLFGSACVYGQVLKTRRNDRVVRVEPRRRIGTAGRLQAALWESEDSETLHTSFVERLTLTIRQGSASLRRRSPCHARGTDQLHGHVDLLRCSYRFIRPHRALQGGRETRTPAMHAGLVNAPMNWSDIFTAPAALYAFHVAVVRVPGAVQLMQTSPAALSSFSWPHEHRSAA